MKQMRTLLLLVSLIAPSISAAATPGMATSFPTLTTTSPASRLACPAPDKHGIATAQVSQSDCCKGHKGVCGCRAGKIVCCDNTVSPSCTCHGDQGLAN